MTRGSASTATPFQTYRDVRFFGSLNGLRFLCIGMVLWHHSPVYAAMEQAPKLLTRGYLGVDFFFVLSGYLITTLLLREEARNGSFSLKDFYIRRMLRIIPVYYLVVTAMSVYWVWVKGMEEVAPLVPYYYLFLSNFLVGDVPLLTVTWSLSVEEQYYLMWPLLLLLLPLLGRAPVVAGLIGICVLTAAGVLGPLLGLSPIVTEHAVFQLPATGYSAILMGTLAALLLHSESGFRALYPLIGHRLAPLVAFGALILALVALPGNLMGWPNVPVHGAMTLCLMTLVAREDNLLAPVLRLSPIARIGEISYGVYLYHMIALHGGVEIGARLGLAPDVALWVQTGLFVGLAVVVAEISFRTFERFFLRFKPVANPASRATKKPHSEVFDPSKT